MFNFYIVKKTCTFFRGQSTSKHYVVHGYFNCTSSENIAFYIAFYFFFSSHFMTCVAWLFHFYLWIPFEFLELYIGFRSFWKYHVRMTDVKTCSKTEFVEGWEKNANMSLTLFFGRGKKKKVECKFRFLIKSAKIFYYLNQVARKCILKILLDNKWIYASVILTVVCFSFKL